MRRDRACDDQRSTSSERLAIGDVGIELSSIKWKTKQKNFPASVSRDDIREGATMLGPSLTDHIANCIAAVQSIAAEIDLLPAGGS